MQSSSQGGPAGPTKEELENYWTNSRQYFDELAKYYKESDSEYYNKYIAPFYNNPFRRQSPSNSSGSAKPVIAGVLIAIMAAGGIASFLLFSQTNHDTNIYEKQNN